MIICTHVRLTSRLTKTRYEVKAQDGLECGGAYMKLLTDSPEGIKFKEFSNDTPYVCSLFLFSTGSVLSRWKLVDWCNGHHGY